MAQANPRRAKKQNETAGAKTRQKIIETASSLFAARGYSGVSLRDIARELELNVAVTNYHFGSKLELFKQVFSEAARPVSNKVIARLAEARQRSDRPEFLELVLRAMIEPSFDRSDANLNNFNRLRAHTFLDEEDFAGALFREFYADQARASMDALKLALPDLSERDIAWRLHLMLGAMVFTSIPSGRFHPVISGTYNPDEPAEAVEQLVHLLLGAFQSQPK